MSEAYKDLDEKIQKSTNDMSTLRSLIDGRCGIVGGSGEREGRGLKKNRKLIVRGVGIVRGTKIWKI